MSATRPRADALLAAAVFCLTAVAATVLWQLTGDAVTDIPLYRTYGERIANGLVPYRDFGFEYPPGRAARARAAGARDGLAHGVSDRLRG